VSKKELFKNLVRVTIYSYINSAKTPELFSADIIKNVPMHLNKDEADSIISHFKKEIYPLNKKTLKWMHENLNGDEIKFCSKHNEMTKLINENKKEKN